MTASVDSLELIAAEAANFGATVKRRATSELVLDVALRRSDWREVPYCIVASSDGPAVAARECRPDRLPAFCPERHINHDGTFCMYWAEHHSINVTDSSSAIEWWQTLNGFLLLQERASKKRRWPDDEGWAHGHAARYQHIAHEAAKRLGERFENALNDGRLNAEINTKGQRRGKMLRLRMDGRHLYSVLLEGARVANRRAPCPCSTGTHAKQVRACKDHANAAGQLASSLYHWEIEERKFWESFDKKTCCGQMDECPLRG